MKRPQTQSTNKNTEVQQAAGILYRLAAASLVIYCILIISGLYYHDGKSILAAVTGIVFEAIPFWLLKKGRLFTASIILMVITFSAATAFATIGQGIRDIALVTFPIIFIFAGLTFSRAILRLSIAMSVIAIGWLAFGERYGWFVPDQISGKPGLSEFIMAVLVLLIAGTAVSLLTNNMRRNLEQLKASEAKFAAIFERAPVAMVRAKIDGAAILETNQELCKLSGYSKQELLNQPITRFLAQPEQMIELFEMLQKDGRIENVEVDLLEKAGIVRNCHVTFNKYAKEEYIEGTYIDITESRKIEQDLKRSEALYRDTFDYAPIGIFRSTEEGKFILANHKLAEMLGFESPHELISIVNKTDISQALFIDPSLRGRLIEGVKSRDGWSILENEYRRKDGSIFTGRLTTRITKKPDGSMDYIDGMVEDITERKRVELAFEKANERLNGILENLQDAYFQIDLSGNFTFANQTACQMYGYDSVDEILGKPVTTLYADLNERSNMIGMLMKSGQVKDFFAKGLRRDGSFFWVSMNAQYIKDHSGKITGTEGVVRDITERKRAEETLRESEERFRRTFDESPIGAAMSTPDFHFIRTNTTMRKMLGYSEDEFSRLTFKDITHPDDMARDVEGIMRLNRGEIQTYETDKRYLCKNGEVIWGHLSTSAIRDGDRLLYYVPLIVDITKRKQAEEKLSDEISRRTQLFSQTPIGIVLFDPVTTDILDFNAIAHQQLGYTRDEFAMLKLGDIEQQETAEETQKHIKQITASGCEEFETVQRTKQGETRCVQVIAHPITISGRTVFQCIWNDITERKKFEKALQESEEKFRNLAEQSPNIIFILLGKNMVYVNDQGVRRTGYSRQQLLSPDFHLLDIIAPESHEQVKSIFNQHGQGNDVPPMEYRIITRESGSFHAMVGTKLIDYGGQRAILGTITDISDRKISEEKVKASLAEKEVILKEIHHRVKNNMQVISSLLQLQSGFVKDKQDALMFQESQRRIYSMSLVYNKLYQSDDLANISFEEYVKDLVGSLVKAYNFGSENLKTFIDIENIQLGLDLAVPCGLIINEVITNKSVKMTMPPLCT